MKPSTKTELLKTIKREVTKEYTLYDGSSRPSKKFIAPLNALDGAPCFVVEYIYSVTFPGTIIGRKEAYDSWSSSYDL
jgi:hypothetical protein